MTTVGYGDTFPVTAAGRGVAALLMLTGIALFGVLTANIAAFFVEEQQEDPILAKLDELRDNWPRWSKGKTVAILRVISSLVT